MHLQSLHVRLRVHRQPQHAQLVHASNETAPHTAHLPRLQASELNQRLKERSITMQLTGALCSSLCSGGIVLPCRILGCAATCRCRRNLPPATCRCPCTLCRCSSRRLPLVQVLPLFITSADAALDYAVAQSYDHMYGARPLRRWLEHSIVTLLSRMIISGGWNEPFNSCHACELRLWRCWSMARCRR